MALKVFSPVFCPRFTLAHKRQEGGSKVFLVPREGGGVFSFSVFIGGSGRVFPHETSYSAQSRATQEKFYCSILLDVYAGLQPAVSTVLKAVLAVVFKRMQGRVNSYL